MPEASLILVWPGPEQSDSAIRALLSDVPSDLIVAVWDPADDDGGRAALLASVREARDVLAARDADADELVLVGVGLGGVAAAGLARYAKRLGIGFGRIIAVAGTWDEPDPFSERSLTEVPEGVELVPDLSYLEAAITCWRPR
jgi:hypothetical protein